jgi:hypothetical protein
MINYEGQRINKGTRVTVYDWGEGTVQAGRKDECGQVDVLWDNPELGIVAIDPYKLDLVKMAVLA